MQAEVQVIASASPCRNIRLVDKTGKEYDRWIFEAICQGIMGDIFLVWEPADKKTRITARDEKRLLEDIDFLVKNLSAMGIDIWRVKPENRNTIIKPRTSATDKEAGAEQHPLAKFNDHRPFLFPINPDHPIVKFWSTWGALFPAKNNRLSLEKLIQGAFNVFPWSFIHMLLNPPRPPAWVGAIEGIFRFDEMRKVPLDPPPRYWEFKPDLSCTSCDKRSFDIPRFYIPHPPQFKSRDEEVLWFKNAIMDSIFGYLSRRGARFISKYSPFQGDKRPAAQPKDNFSLMAVVDDLFLFWLFRIFVDHATGETDQPLCECGCGRPVPIGRIKWATDACERKAIDKRPARQVKAWLRTIIKDKDSRQKLYPLVDKLAKKGYSKEKIKATLKREDIWNKVIKR